MKSSILHDGVVNVIPVSPKLRLLPFVLFCNTTTFYYNCLHLSYANKAVMISLLHQADDKDEFVFVIQ